MQLTMTLPVETFERLQRARRLELFEKVPSTSGLARRFIEEGLSRLEQSSPRAVAAAEGTITTNPNGSR